MTGSNKIGMLGWHVTMKTPTYPEGNVVKSVKRFCSQCLIFEGREVVIIANDVTVQSGSFGVLEDDFFYKASEYARKHGLPRIHIACNSGARIGMSCKDLQMTE
jgi:acetyl-CoA carboxylase/biotin carboxylase 1